MQQGLRVALAVMAFRAWSRRGEIANDPKVAPPSNGAPTRDETRAAGFSAGSGDDPAFERAIVRILVAAARADGRLDDREKRVLTSAFAQADLDAEERAAFTNAMTDAELRRIADAARTPGQRAELYVAAAAMCDDPAPGETTFLARLAAALQIDDDYAEATRAEMMR